MSGKTCAGTLVSGCGKNGEPRTTYLFHVVLELLESGAWKGAGVLGPAAFPAQPFLDKLAELGSPHGVLELS
jgi:hypothetical protein